MDDKTELKKIFFAKYTMLGVLNFIVNWNLNLSVIPNKVLVGSIPLLKMNKGSFIIAVIKYLFIRYKNGSNKIFSLQFFLQNE